MYQKDQRAQAGGKFKIQNSAISRHLGNSSGPLPGQFQSNHPGSKKGFDCISSRYATAGAALAKNTKYKGKNFFDDENGDFN